MYGQSVIGYVPKWNKEMFLRPAVQGWAGQLGPLLSLLVYPLWGPLGGRGSVGKAEQARPWQDWSLLLSRSKPRQSECNDLVASVREMWRETTGRKHIWGPY